MLKRSHDDEHSSRVERPLGIDDASYDDVGLDLRELVAVIRRRAMLIASVTVLVALAGLIYAMQLVPVYTATASVLVDPRRTSLVDTKSVVSSIGKDSSAIDSEVELIKSTSVALRVVKKLGLHKAGASILERQPTLMESLIQGTRALLSRAPVRKQIDGRDALLASDEQKLAAKLKDGITVARKEWTYVIEVSYTDEDPVFAAQIAIATSAIRTIPNR